MNTNREQVAYSLNLISDETLWLKMIQDRNLTAHTYNQELAHELYERIRDEYLPLFEKLENTILEYNQKTS